MSGQNNHTSKKGIVIAAIVVFVAIIAAIVVFMFLPSNISREEAREIAIEFVGGGTAAQPERDFERFQRAWYVTVRHEGGIIGVYVSMRTGEVLSADWD
ncbi:MAG: PepSY domain-containing protein [Defluviitaleaceae bacterium]|nr:PepSY domain-containing protein [Defluviitaleaceae bacterium]